MRVLVPDGTRNPGLSAYTSPDTVPAGAAGRQFLLQASVPSQADLDDPAVQFEVMGFIRLPDGTWPTVPQITIPFRGGPNQGRGGTPTTPPGRLIDGNGVAGKTIRFRLNNTGRAFVGGLIVDEVG